MLFSTGILRFIQDKWLKIKRERFTFTFYYEISVRIIQSLIYFFNKYTIVLNPSIMDVRKLKAEALCQMACVSTGANDQAYLTSQALSLESKVTLAHLVPLVQKTAGEGL